jgi:hypothetical protein
MGDILTTGLEKIGENSAGANAIFSKDVDILDALLREYLTCQQAGFAKSGVYFRKVAFPYDVYVESVIWNGLEDPKAAGADVVVRVRANGSATYDFTIAQADLSSGYKKVDAATPTTILVTAGQALEVMWYAVGTTEPGYNMAAILQLRKRKLS